MLNIRCIMKHPVAQCGGTIIKAFALKKRNEIKKKISKLLNFKLAGPEFDQFEHPLLLEDSTLKETN